MRNYKFPIVLLILSFTFFMRCSDDSSSNNDVDEFNVLITYLEGAGGDYVNTYAPAIKTAEAVYTALGSGEQYLIDIRSTDAFNAGHVDGAVQVDFANLLTHVEGLTSDPDEIIIICYSGQTAAYGTALLRLMGHDNVYSMKWGMSSWTTANASTSWSTKITSSPYSTDFVTTSSSIGGNVAAPVLNTGLEAPADILRARVEALFVAGFGDATIGGNIVVPNYDDYYIVNYWPQAHYDNPGHIPGAYCYVPKTDLKTTTKLYTLPANETVVVYCYTGQTSANIAAFLKVLGYDAKTLTYGTNGMIYDDMTTSQIGHQFSAAEIKDYPVVVPGT